MLTKQRLTESQVSTTLEVLCPGCGHEYPWAILPFLYADELGHRCPDRGSVLIVEAGEPPGKAQGPCHLMLSEHLEGTCLHEKLAELVGGGDGVELLVDRAGETRNVSVASQESAGFAESHGYTKA